MITHQEIVDYMQAMLAKAHEKYPYASLTICLNANKSYPKPVSFELYTNMSMNVTYGASFEECFEKHAADTPEVVASKLRAQAADLLAEADKLSPKTP